jgi:hypothetical protein
MLTRVLALFGAASVLAFGAIGCAMPTSGDQGGAVIDNDRSNGGAGGSELLTGVMLVSPSGKYSLLQRNDVSVIVDVDGKTARELPFQAQRFVFSHHSDVGYAWDPKGELVAIDLLTVKELWRVAPSSSQATLLALDDNDSAVVVGGLDRAAIIDAKDGSFRREVFLPSAPTFSAFIPGKDRVVIVGSTTWSDHKPDTAVTVLDLAGANTVKLSVPNCSAPIAILPDASRGLLSPTYCQEAKTDSSQSWTNPDPVSIVDFDANGSAHFLKNLPGFGPVALDPSGNTAVAYLDTARMDASMFDDKSIVPSTSGDPFHLMVIDTHTLKFSLTPIGHSLPRFAMSRDGQKLLVDASVRVQRMEASATISFDATGVRAELKTVFGSDAPFGTFDLATKQYAAFQGPVAALDRFVQTSDQKVFTLKATADGLGGDLFAIDLNQRTTVNLGKSLRDIGLLPDGHTLLLRIRLPAVKRDDGFHRKEQLCFSLDGIQCETTLEYESKAPIPGSSSTCTDYHDC